MMSIVHICLAAAQQHVTGFMTCHLWTDYLETRISSGPNTHIKYGTTFRWLFGLVVTCWSGST